MQEGLVLLRGGTLWTATGKILTNHDLLVRGTRIAALGRGLKVKGARVIDIRGKHLTPGIIDTHSHMGVYPSPSARAHADGNESAKPVTAYANSAYGFWPQDPSIPRAVQGGTTTAQILPGSANLIGGRSVTLHLRWGRSVQEMKFPGAPQGIKMACGENPKRVYRRRGVVTRMGNVAKTRMAFQKAVEYKRSWDQYAKALAAWKKNSTKKTAKKKQSKKPKMPRKDLNLESLKQVIEGKLLVHIHCYRADDMRWMMSIADEFGFRIRSFHHAVEAYKIRDILSRRNIAVSVWADWWGFKLEAFDTIEENAAMFSAAGGRTIIHSDSAVGIQRLNQESAKAYFRGLDMGLKLRRDDAIRWITINPAWALGIDHLVGTLEVGKMADLTVWDGHPLSVYTRTSKVFIEGKVVYDRKRPRFKTDFEIGLKE